MEYVIFERGKSNFKLHQHQWIGRYYRVVIFSISCRTAFFINKNYRDSLINSIIKLFLPYRSGPFCFRRDFRWYRICILHILLLRAWYQLHNVSSYRGFFCLCVQYLVHFLLHHIWNNNELDWMRLFPNWALHILDCLRSIKLLGNSIFITYQLWVKWEQNLYFGVTS